MLIQILALVAVSQAHKPQVTRVLDSDFDRLSGKPWKGTLTYLDYTSNKQTTIKSSLFVERVKSAPSSWKWNVGYTDEPEHNGGETIAITASGTMLDGEKVIERKELPGHKIRIVTQFIGDDNKKPATNRHVYSIADAECSLQKLVKFKTDKDFFQRHIYRWTR